MLKLLIAGLLILVSSLIIYFFSKYEKVSFPPVVAPITITQLQLTKQKLKIKSASLKTFIRNNNFSEDYSFFIDMSLHSGQERFFIYDLNKDSIIYAGLVAHGSCNTSYAQSPQFSNVINSGCSSLGKYKIGYAYNGQFGKAYKLFGLDSCNSNAFDRAVVLHAYNCVPDEEVYPETMCNSLGCPMVSPNFLQRAAQIIDHSNKPILLSIYL